MGIAKYISPTYFINCKHSSKALLAMQILDFVSSSDVNVKNERKKDASIPSNSNIAAKQPSKHEDVNINKVVKAIALPLLLSVTDALFGE